MARLVTTLEQYAEQLGQEDNRHPLLSPATLSVGTITGGISVNTVPDRCSIEIDRRLLPDEDPQAAFSAVKEHLAENLPPGDAAEHDPLFLSAGGLSDQNNAALAQSLQNVVRGQGVACRQVGVPYGTNASAISATGIPSVVFGPGSIEQAHTADEWIDIEQMNRAAAILLEFCSGQPF
jgi:acetylornithine deacetylase